MRQKLLAATTAIAIAGAVALLALPRDPDAPVDLRAAEKKVFSQFGEDGVIEKIFEVIAPTHGYAIEFGAYDGIHNSNTRNLIVNKGWGGLLIEGNPARAAALIENHKGYPGVTALHAWVYPGNIEVIFDEAGAPPDPDLLVIDFHPMNYWDHDRYTGASLQSLYKLAKRKGYELVYSMSFGPDAFFVDKKYYDRFGIEDNSPAKLFQMWGTPEHDGTLPPGKRFLRHGASGYKSASSWIVEITGCDRLHARRSAGVVERLLFALEAHHRGVASVVEEAEGARGGPEGIRLAGRDEHARAGPQTQRTQLDRAMGHDLPV
ncbi:MAG: hypothetical protein VX681_09995 [Myxococcota bacterium]|nr:hypothetical protein [Myxococcota bacterium]